MRRRAAAIILSKGPVAPIKQEEGAVALIERQRAGRRYYVFPGGGVEPGEELAAAAVREVREEVGLAIAVRQLVALVWFQGDLAAYYRATVIGGQFGAGHGDEAQGRRSPERGSYRPVWLPLADLATQPVYPPQVRDLVAAGGQGEWPTAPRVIYDTGLR